MRQAGTIPNKADANRFVDYLFTQGIEAKADPFGDQWAIWIYDETRLAEGKSALADFQANPSDAKYADVDRKAAALRREQAATQRKAAGNVVEVRQRWRTPAMGATPITIALIAICVLVGIATKFGKQLDPIRPYLFIAKISSDGFGGMGYLPGLQEVRHGEVWRLVTPIFIHMDMLHLLFNMMWLWVFGRAIESRRGSLRFILLVLASAALSNFAQYAYQGPELIFFGRETSGGPMFGGMSGVNYALFGYCWMRSRFVPTEPPYLDERTTFMFMLWFVVCLTGAVGAVANVAHGVGLMVGSAVGYLPKLLRR